MKKYSVKLFPKVNLRLLYLTQTLKLNVKQFSSKGNRYFHGGDLARIKIFMTYGGIYLDNDVYVIQNLDKYRKFECALNWQRNLKELGTQANIDL